MTTKQLQFAQGTMNAVGGRRIGIVNVGTENERAWAKLMVIGGPAQIDARVDEGVPFEIEGLGTLTLVGIAVPADPGMNRGPVIDVEIELATNVS